MFLSLLIPALAFATDCHQFQANEDVYRCLNEYARAQLAEGSAADQAFKERLNRLLDKYDLNAQQVKHSPLAESFSLVVDKKPQARGTDGLCFDFESRGWLANRKKNVTNILRQIDEAALFLAEIHASSWGHQVSLLFPIKEVSLCSYRQLHNREVLFEQRSLMIGLRNKPISAAGLLEKWNSGNPVRSTELSWVNSIPFLGAKLRLMKQRNNPEGILRDKIADQWLVLNPVGSLRTTALYTLGEAIFKLRHALGDEQSAQIDTGEIYRRLGEAVKGAGFTARDEARIQALRGKDEQLRQLYNLWQQKIYSPQNILTVIENSIGDQARRDSNIHLVLRKINAGVAVVNDKNISVSLEALMDNSLPVASFEGEKDGNRDATIEITRSETVTKKTGETETKSTTFKIEGVDPKDLSVNADEINGAVAIDLIDNVIVSVKIPRVSPAAYRRISLYQAMQEYENEGAGAVRLH